MEYMIELIKDLQRRNEELAIKLGVAESQKDYWREKYHEQHATVDRNN